MGTKELRTAAWSRWLRMAMGTKELWMAAWSRWPRMAMGTKELRTAAWSRWPRTEVDIRDPRIAVWLGLRHSRTMRQNSTGERLVARTAEWQPHVMTAGWTPSRPRWNSIRRSTVRSWCNSSMTSTAQLSAWRDGYLPPTRTGIPLLRWGHHMWRGGNGSQTPPQTPPGLGHLGGWRSWLPSGYFHRPSEPRWSMPAPVSSTVIGPIFCYGK